MTPIAARAETAAGVAMQIRGRLPVQIAGYLPMDLVAVGDAEQTLVERCDWWMLDARRRARGH